MDEVLFVVEQAGCSSCAARIRQALGPIATVETIEVDEAADAATVRLLLASPLSPEAVGRALQEASAGSGHEYRLRPGSWSAVVA